MSETLTKAVDSEAVRRLVLTAWAAVTRIGMLESEASSATDRRWARLTADAVASDWRRFRRRLERGETDYFWPGLSSIVASTIPLSDAPTELVEGATAARLLTSSLAHDLRTTMPALCDKNLKLRTEIIPELASAMREAAAALPSASAED